MEKTFRKLIILFLGILFAINFYSVFLVENDLLYDFSTFVEAGRAVAEGRDPYAFDGPGSRNLNPPVSLFIFRGLANQDPFIALSVFRVLSFFLYFFLLYVIYKSYPQYRTFPKILWAVSMTGIWYTLWAGQVYVFLLAFITAAWLLLKRTPILAGFLIGVLAAFKLNFLIWPAMILLSGKWKIALAAFFCFSFLTILPGIVFGFDIYRIYIDLLMSYQATKLPNNITLYGISDRLGFPIIGIILSILIFCGLTILVWIKKPASSETSALALTSTLLLSPLAWVGYTVFLIPIFSSRIWSARLTVAAALLLTPGVLVFATSKTTLLLIFIAGLIYPTALILILIDLLNQIISEEKNYSELHHQDSG